MYDVDLEEFTENLEIYEDCFSSELKIEFCAYDTNPSHDYKWLATTI